MEETSRTQDAHILALAKAYRTNLDDIIRTAQAVTFSRLARELTVDANGRIAPTVGNNALLRKMDSMFMEEMDNAGYKTLSHAFASSFTGTLPSFRKTLANLSESMKNPLPRIQFRTSDIRELSQQQVNAETMLREVVENGAQTAKQRALFNIGTLNFTDLVKIFSDKAKKTLGQSETLATTSVHQYLATMNQRAVEQIEEETGKVALYSYLGPLDRLTRDFCRKMMKKTRKKPITRAEFDEEAKKAGQTIRWNCRHALYAVKLVDA